jgi:hypothetical protein
VNRIPNYSELYSKPPNSGNKRKSGTMRTISFEMKMIRVSIQYEFGVALDSYVFATKGESYRFVYCELFGRISSFSMILPYFIVT